jgi:hypothetical protein
MIGLDVRVGSWPCESHRWAFGIDVYVGVVTRWKPPNPFDQVTSAHLEHVLKLVGEGEYRENPQSKNWVGHVVAQVLGLTSPSPPLRRRSRRSCGNGSRPARWSWCSGRTPMAKCDRSSSRARSSTYRLPHLEKCGAEKYGSADHHLPHHHPIGVRGVVRNGNKFPHLKVRKGGGLHRAKLSRGRPVVHAPLQICNSGNRGARSAPCAQRPTSGIANENTSTSRANALIRLVFLNRQRSTAVGCPTQRKCRCLSCQHVNTVSGT